MSTPKQILQNLKLVSIVALAWTAAGCGSTVQPDFPAEGPRSAATRPSAAPSESRDRSAPSNGAHYDLSKDERRGGHTLEKHVGRSDDELRERLDREGNISAASTWTDRDAAEETVGEALQKDQEQISRWEARRSAPEPRAALQRRASDREEHAPRRHNVFALHASGDRLKSGCPRRFLCADNLSGGSPVKREKKERPSAEFDAASFPGLQEFFSGYLHEDFVDEYGSAAGAARAFCGDASREEAAQASTEWTKLSSLLDGKPISEVQPVLQKLGGAWRPEDLEELHSVDVVFKRTGEPKP